MHPENQPDFCCAIRRKYLIGIVAIDQSIPTPADAADFIDFDQRLPDGRLVMRIKFCPFCGKNPNGPLRVAGQEN